MKARKVVTSKLVVGTRASALAQAQTRLAIEQLQQASGNLLSIEVKAITSRGDQIQDRSLADIGGKGLFSKELDQALLDKDIDLAVHSLKDLESTLPDGIKIGAVLPREDPHDALISAETGGLDALKQGALIGTSSVRRQALLRALRPDLRFTLLRGNIETRLSAVRDGKIDATLLAVAGLKRMGFDPLSYHILPAEIFLPAVGQGVIAVTIRSDAPDFLKDLLASVNDPETNLCSDAERQFLVTLDGSCKSPIAGYALLQENQTIFFRGCYAAPDGSLLHVTRSGPKTDSLLIGEQAAQDILARLFCSKLPA